MAKFAVIFVAALALHAVLAAPKKTQETNQLEQLGNQIQAVANDVSASLQKAVPDSKTIVAQSREFQNQIENIVKKLQTEIDANKGKTNELVGEVSVKLGETIHSLQELAGNENSAKATDLKNQFEANVKTAAAEIEKLGKDVQPHLQQAGDSVNTFLQGVFNDFLKATQDVKTNVDKAVSKH